ncbi:MAG: NAD(P)H-hydrate epimerase [Candidatus Caldarchaeales archaeon]
MRAYSSADIEVVDLNSEYLGVSRRTLMENAGRAVAEYVLEHEGSLRGKRVVVLAGPGNNGGDAFVAARHLAGLCGSLTVVLVSREGVPRTEEARNSFRPLTAMRLTARVIVVASESLGEDARKEIEAADIVIDGLFGTGVKGGIREPYRSAIKAVNSSRARVYSIDVPSGLNPDTAEGELFVRADHTVCLHGLKPFAGRVRAGTIAVRPIGAPPEAEVIAGPGDVAVAARAFTRGIQVRVYGPGDDLSEGASAVASLLGARVDVVESGSFRVEAEGIGFAFGETARERDVLLERSRREGEQLEESLEVARRSKELGRAVWRLGGPDAFCSAGRLKANWIEPEHLDDFTAGVMVGLAAVLAGSCPELHCAVGAAIYASRRALRNVAGGDRERYLEEVTRTISRAG